MPDTRANKATGTLKDEDIKSISEVVRVLLREELDASLQQVASKLDAMQTELASLTTRIISAEGEMATVESDTKKNSAAISTVQEKQRSFEQKMADLEDRSRRCNIRVYGLPENIEKDEPVQYLQRMLPVWFPTLKHPQPEIERAHRIFRGAPPKEGERPRAFIFCCLRFPTRQAILREARKHPPSVGNRLLRFAADFSDYTARRRRAFSRAMATAREKGTDAFLLYPATLKIRHGQTTHLFSSPADAERFLERRPSSPRHTGGPTDDELVVEQQASPVVSPPSFRPDIP